jgi:hypothetical protein
MFKEALFNFYFNISLYFKARNQEREWGVIVGGRTDTKYMT